MDRKILAELQRAGRLTVTELSQRVNLSVAACQRRLRELERSAVITGYRAVIDMSALGLGFDVLVSVTMDREDASTIAAFETGLTSIPEIRQADRLFGDKYRWSVLGAGRNQMPIAAMAAAMGGNVRVGLEDSLWIGPGKLAESNAQQVTQVRKIVEGLGLEIASPDEAREILALKGGDKVAF